MDHNIKKWVYKILRWNEINPNLKKFLDTNSVWKKFIKNKEEFKNIRERLIEISNKLGISPLILRISK